VTIVDDERVVRFIARECGVAFCPPFYAIGTERDGEVINGVLFNHFENSDVHVSVAGHGWTRGFLRAVGRYVFEGLGCERMTAITRCEDVAGFARRLGGQVEGVLRNHFGAGHDGIMLGILREEYRFGP
jgi:RimJ/RimL family protein N-acetyltransferase